jgi:putative salt-induced outer membrane protein YdiY
MRYIICFFLFTVIHKTSFGQIVNIESQRIQSDTTGWFGNIGTGFLFEKNAIEVININSNAHVEYKSPKSLYLLLVNYSLLEGSGQTLNNNLFYHLRYNYKINKWMRWEVFTQLQQNSVTGIKLRLLAGSGPRFKLVRTKHVALYAATAGMYEYEKEQTDPTIYHRDLRSSSYLSFTYNPSKHVELMSTVFYQPLFGNFSDYRILNEINLKLTIVKHFSFTASWSYLYDSRPATGIPKLNYSISNGITYDF